MHSKLTVCVCCAGNTGESILSAAWTELLGHIFRGEEASMATFDKGLEMADPLEGRGRKQVQVHL